MAEAFYGLISTKEADDREYLAEIRFQALRKWRNELARAQGRPSFTVLSNRTLSEIAVMAPESKDALLDVFGMGPIKIAQYGGTILEILRETTPTEHGKNPTFLS